MRLYGGTGFQDCHARGEGGPGAGAGPLSAARYGKYWAPTELGCRRWRPRLHCFNLSLGSFGTLLERCILKSDWGLGIGREVVEWAAKASVRESTGLWIAYLDIEDMRIGDWEGGGWVGR